MSRLKKLNLQSNKKEEKKDNPFKTILNKTPLFYSTFCLTDNLNFAFFYADAKIFVDNIPAKALNKFKFDEVDLDMEIDRLQTIQPSKGVKEVNLGIGQIDRNIFNLVKTLYPDCVFHPLKSFFGQTVNSLIIVLHEEYGKPIGLLKTH